MLSSVFLNFTDPYPYQAAIGGVQLQFLPTEKGDLRAELTKFNAIIDGGLLGYNMLALMGY